MRCSRVVFLLWLLCAGVCSGEYTLQAEIDRVLEPLSPRARRYIEVCIEHRGKLPTLKLSAPASLNIGDMGYSDIDRIGVDQVTSDEHVLAYGSRYMIQLGSTEGMTDEDVLVGCQKAVFYYVENESYTTVLGATRTVIGLMMMEVHTYANALEQVMDLASYREWSNTDGTFTTVAKFVDFGDGNVSLKKYADKKSIDVPMSVLSEDDQEWVRKEMRARTEERKQERERIKAGLRRGD